MWPSFGISCFRIGEFFGQFSMVHREDQCVPLVFQFPDLGLWSYYTHGSSMESQLQSGLAAETEQVIVVEPYKFVPPKSGTFVAGLLQPIVPWQIKKAWNVVGHELRGISG